MANLSIKKHLKETKLNSLGLYFFKLVIILQIMILFFLLLISLSENKIFLYISISVSSIVGCISLLILITKVLEYENSRSLNDDIIEYIRFSPENDNEKLDENDIMNNIIIDFCNNGESKSESLGDFHNRIIKEVSLNLARSFLNNDILAILNRLIKDPPSGSFLGMLENNISLCVSDEINSRLVSMINKMIDSNKNGLYESHFIQNNIKNILSGYFPRKYIESIKKEIQNICLNSKNNDELVTKLNEVYNKIIEISSIKGLLNFIIKDILIRYLEEEYIENIEFEPDLDIFKNDKIFENKNLNEKINYINQKIDEKKININNQEDMTLLNLEIMRKYYIAKIEIEKLKNLMASEKNLINFLDKEFEENNPNDRIISESKVLDPYNIISIKFSQKVPSNQLNDNNKNEVFALQNNP